MKKAVGLALAVTFGLSLPAAAAEQTKGMVQSVDRLDQSIIMDDGTRLWVESGAPINEVRAGDRVEATFELKGDKNVMKDLQRESPESGD